MFHSGSLAAVIHADRQRESAIAARNRRLLEPVDEMPEPAPGAAVRTLVAAAPAGTPRVAKTAGSSGSACEAA